MSRKLTQSLLCTPTYTTLVSDCFRTGLLVSVISSQPFPRLNLSLPTYHQRFWIYVDRLTYNACYERSVTDASNPKKQIYFKCLATIYSTTETRKQYSRSSKYLIWICTSVIYFSGYKKPRNESQNILCFWEKDIVQRSKSFGQNFDPYL